VARDRDGSVDVRAEAGPCPVCGAVEARPVLYGLPDAATFRDLQDQVVFAGCTMPPVPHPYVCAVCGARWGA